MPGLANPLSPPTGWGSQKPPLGVRLDRSHPLAAGCVGRWTGAEATGCTVEDHSLGGNRGRLIGGAKYDGTSIVLSGAAGCYCDCGNGPALNLSSNQFSILVWVFLVQAATCDIIGKMAGSNGYSLSLLSTGKVICFAGGNPWSCYRYLKGTLSVGAWTHVAFTRSGMNPIIAYRNGVEASDGTGGTTELLETGNSTTSLRFGHGGRYATSGMFNGRIHDVAIYNRALSPSEIAQYYRSTYCMFESGNPAAFLTTNRRRVLLGAA